MLKGSSGSLSAEIRVLPSRTLVLNSGLGKFCHGTLIVAKFYQLSWTKVDAERDKLDRRRWTKLTVRATVDGRFITLIVVHLCLQHDAVARVHLRQLVAVCVRCRQDPDGDDGDWDGENAAAAETGRVRSAAVQGEPAGRPFRLSFVPLKLIHTATPDTTRLSRLPVDRRRRDAGQA